MRITVVTTVSEFEEYKRIGEEIKSLGHDFYLIDLNNFSFNNLSGSLEVSGLNNLDTDLVIVRGIFNSIKPISEIIKSFRKNGIKVFDNNLLDHSYSIDKVTDLVKLSLNKIKIPKTCYARDFRKLLDMSKSLGFPVVVKSTRAGKGDGVYKADSQSHLEKLLKDLSKNTDVRYLIAQEFIPYKFDLRVLVIGSHVFAMRRIPKEGEFRANFSLGGKVELFDLEERDKNLAVEALKAVGMSIGGVDILITENGERYILEVNHTAGFIGMETATGKNIGKLYVEHAISNAK